MVARDETPAPATSRKSRTEARVQQGRHGYGRQLLVDLGRRRGAGADERAPRPRARGLKPLARVLAYASHAQEPEWFTTAPVGAIKKMLAKLGWRPHDADLYEINEAFAVVAMAAMHDLDIDHARVNVNGGACALGHPIGATGARILTTLIHALQAAAASAASRRCASAAAKRSRWPSRWSGRRGFVGETT